MHRVPACTYTHDDNDLGDACICVFWWFSSRDSTQSNILYNPIMEHVLHYHLREITKWLGTQEGTYVVGRGLFSISIFFLFL